MRRNDTTPTVKPLYGPGGLPAPGSGALPGNPGYLLHAAEVSFRRPGGGRELVLECEPPLLLRCKTEMR